MSLGGRGIDQVRHEADRVFDGCQLLFAGPPPALGGCSVCEFGHLCLYQRLAKLAQKLIYWLILEPQAYENDLPDEALAAQEEIEKELRLAAA